MKSIEQKKVSNIDFIIKNRKAEKSAFSYFGQ